MAMRREFQRLRTSVLAGAAGGLASSALLGLGMLAARKLGLGHAPLPVRLERWAEQEMGVAGKVPPQEEYALAATGHLMLGTVYGIGFGLANTIATRFYKIPALVVWPGYGMLLYLLNFLALGPLLGITRPAWRESAHKFTGHMVEHMAFGLVIALVTDQIEKRSKHF